MVYQRDQAIKNFKPEPYFELNAEILANQQKFVAKLDPYQRFKDETWLITFMQAKHVQKVLVQIFLADLILVYWVPRNEGLRA